ncbi:MAG: type II toxin-antitoxin system RelE/ParE family toxin, partial [bacterium]
MKYQIQFDQAVKKILQHFSPIRKKQMRESLRCLADEPYLGKELQEELTGLMSLRVGTHRIIYKLNTE